jgi:UTP-glucose-1-phosphate uridylyltransferase
MLHTAVIPCGGLGTRLQPITRWLPKELLAADAAPPDSARGRPARLVGRFVFPGDAFTELEAAERAGQAGVEVDGLGVLRGLARRGQLAGALAQAAWYEVGLPDGYRSAVADFPARA